MIGGRNWGLMQFFKYDHLPPKLQEFSKPFAELALQLNEVLPDNSEKTTMLRRLLEAKDCAVRAFLFRPTKAEIAEMESKAKEVAAKNGFLSTVGGTDKA
mgnify:CR=1 FL=1